MLRNLLPLLAAAVLFAGCTPEDAPGGGNMQAYVPVYVSTQNMEDIAVKPAKSIVNPGKMYVFGNYLFQNELNEGIHIIDVTNPGAPVKLGFLQVPLSTEVAVKGGYLYTNNHDDLVVFNLATIANPALVKRIPDVFTPVNQDYPPYQNVYFECPDKKKGVVARWELKTIPTPNCRR